MRSLLILTGLATSFAAWPLQAALLDVESRIDAVVVYNNGATVTRIAQVNLPAGTTSLRFSNLVSSVSQERLQLETNQPNITLGQIRLQTVQQRDAYDAEFQRLQRDIEAKQLSINTIADASTTALLKLQFLEGIAQGYAKESWFEGARGSADVTSWRQALQVLEDGSTQARATLRNNQTTTSQLEKELSKLGRELAALQGGALSSKQLNVQVTSNKAQQITLKLHYFQYQASWSPQFEARLSSEASNLRLVQKAVVIQATDEDWSNIALTLSTSEPSGALASPQLPSVFLDYQRAKLRKEKADLRAFATPQALQEVIGIGSRDDGIEQNEIDLSTVRSYSISYDIPGRVNVTNRNHEPQLFEITSNSFNVNLVTQVVPQFSRDAFLTARFTYNQDTPLYGNDMRVYVDGTYVGETTMPTALPQDEITLPMGQDRRIDVEIKPQGTQKDTAGIVGKRKEELTSTVFVITNRRASATAIEVFDRYPIAQHKDIRVEIPRDATSPTNKDWQDRPGIVMWQRSLAGGESWRINHQYEVSYPANKQIEESYRLQLKPKR